MCVSRRLLSADAYHNLALARQAGDHVEAGLTFVAEDDDEEEEEEERESKGASRKATEEGTQHAAGAAASQGAASAGTNAGNDTGSDNNGAPREGSNADGGGGVSGSPDGAEEEDDLYGDLYGGLDDDDGGADMDVVPNTSAEGDGGDIGVGVMGAGGGLDGGGVAEAGAGGGGDGMVEDVSTRAVMNALKVRENLPTCCPAGTSPFFSVGGMKHSIVHPFLVRCVVG